MIVNTQLHNEWDSKKCSKQAVAEKNMIPMPMKGLKLTLQNIPIGERSSR